MRVVASAAALASAAAVDELLPALASLNWVMMAAYVHSRHAGAFLRPGMAVDRPMYVATGPLRQPTAAHPPTSATLLTASWPGLCVVMQGALLYSPCWCFCVVMHNVLSFSPCWCLLPTRR